MYDVVSGRKLDESFKDSDMDSSCRFIVDCYVFLSDGDEYVFMDSGKIQLY